MTNKKNCSNTRGYACGNTCISMDYECYNGEIGGVSNTLANNLLKYIESAAGTPLRISLDNPIVAPKTPASTPSSPKKDSLKEQYKKHVPLKNFFDLDDDDIREELRDKMAKESGVEDPESLVFALELYTSSESTEIRMADAGLKSRDPGNDSNNAAIINEYIEKAPAYDGRLYHGFSRDMKDVYGIDNLKVGSEFSFPSITSFSSSQAVSEEFGEAGSFEILNNKTAPSIVAFSNLYEELEVLTNKEVKYKVVDISDGKYVLEEI